MPYESPIGPASRSANCCRPNDVAFTATAGTTEFVKRWQPKPGDIVTFKHRGFLPGSGKHRSCRHYMGCEKTLSGRTLCATGEHPIIRNTTGELAPLVLITWYSVQCLPCKKRHRMQNGKGIGWILRTAGCFSMTSLQRWDSIPPPTPTTGCGRWERGSYSSQGMYIGALFLFLANNHSQ
jgi:hypothetical protein